MAKRKKAGKKVKRVAKKKVRKKGFNGFAIAGFICAFFVQILGIIFSAIAIDQIKKYGGKGMGLAIAGLAIAILFFIIGIVMAVVAKNFVNLMSPVI